MKIQIKSLHIVDCGPIKDAIFDFADENGVPRDTTLMTGANGSGKTTILRLILALAIGLSRMQESSRSTKNRVNLSQYRDILSRTRHARMDWLIDGEPFSLISGSEADTSPPEWSGIRFFGDLVEPILSKLAKALEELGSNILVLVEGIDDQAVFEELFFSRLGEVTFYPAGGNLEVKSLLSEATEKRPDITAFGIRDRDFTGAPDVATRLQDPEERLFLLTWFSIENYLLTPDAVWNVLRVWFSRNPPLAAVSDVETFLFGSCRELPSVSAANRLLVENQKRMLGENEDLPRERVAEKVQFALGCLKPEAETLLAAKEVEVDQALTDVESAYTRISGKFLLQRIFAFTNTHRNAMPPKRIFDQTLEWLKANKEPRPHLVEIVDGKILSSKLEPV